MLTVVITFTITLILSFTLFYLVLKKGIAPRIKDTIKDAIKYTATALGKNLSCADLNKLQLKLENRNRKFNLKKPKVKYDPKKEV